MADDGLLGLLADRGIRLKSLAPNFNGHVVCGRCGGGKTREVSLSVTIDEDGQGATWICHRGGCGWKDGVRVAQDRAPGRSRDADRPTQRPAPHSPQQAANRPQWLWDFFSERAIGAKVVQDFGIFGMQRRFADPVGQSNCIVFPYRWKGEVVNSKYRPHPAKNPMLQEKNALPTLFNADSLGGEEVVFVEGEMDVCALAECGIRNAVSLKDGAPAQAGGDGQKRFDALATHQDELEKAKKIILAGDMDAPGLALREELSRRLGRHRCWTVQWPEGCKDAGDVLRLVGPDAVLAALAAAVPWPIEGLRYVTPTTLLELRRQPAPTTMSTGTRASDEVLRLPTEGRLIIVTGVPAAGKTSWLRFVMVHTAKDHDRRWCVFSPESQPWGQFVAQCAEAYSGKPFYYEPGIECMSDAETVEASTWLSRKMMMLLCDAEDEMPTPDWLLDRAKASLLRFGTTDLVLDPWNEITQARGAMSETDYTGMVLQRLRAFAQRYGVNVWIVVHPAKPPPLRAGEKRTVIGPYDLAGSAHFANKSDLGITVHSPLAGEAELHIWKSRSRRWAVRGKKCKLDYDALVGRYSTPISQLASPEPMPEETRRDLF